jgi:hypothetical protein
MTDCGREFVSRSANPHENRDKADLDSYAAIAAMIARRRRRETQDIWSGNFRPKIQWF